ncbi:MAG: hypothetical protein ACI9F2_000971 [Lysobacterales bacterium]|jgi:hypothetical protein
MNIKNYLDEIEAIARIMSAIVVKDKSEKEKFRI